MERPIILFDTDMESDCDDAGALALLLNACRAGEAQLLGVIADAPGTCVAPCCEAFLRHYGVSAPIGAVRAAEYAQSPRFAAYRAHCAAMPPRMFYNRTLAAQVGRTDADYEDAARAYRRMLVSAGDGSVTLVCVGFLTALAALLLTGPDDLRFAAPQGQAAHLHGRRARRREGRGELQLRDGSYRIGDLFRQMLRARDCQPRGDGRAHRRGPEPHAARYPSAAHRL